MLNKEQANAIELGKRVMLIIFSALVFGVVGFAVIASIVRLVQEDTLFNMDFGLMAILGVAFAAIVLLPSFIVPMILQKKAVKEVAKEFADNLGETRAAKKMLMSLQTNMIVGMSLLNGAAFFNLIAFLIDGSAFNMIAVAALLTCMIARIPLPGRVEDKIANMLDDAKHQ